MLELSLNFKKYSECEFQGNPLRISSWKYTFLQKYLLLTIWIYMSFLEHVVLHIHTGDTENKKY